METLEEAYKQVKKSKGAPGIDRKTFEEIEATQLISVFFEIDHFDFFGKTNKHFKKI